MKDPQLKFEKLLEQYVFKVTIEIIDLVSSKTQTKLIQLFTSINKEPSPRAKQSKAEVKAIRRLIAIHQITIEVTLGYILRVDDLIEKARKTIPNTAKNVVLIASYLSLKNRYSVALVKVQALQQKDINSIE
jgi:hypothetical protein